MKDKSIVLAIVIIFGMALAFLYQRQVAIDSEIEHLKSMQEDRQLADYLACTAGTLCDHLYPVQAAKVKAANEGLKKPE